MQRFLVQCCSLLLFAVVTATTALAQSGTIQGTIVDPQGNAVSGARVEAIDEAKGLVVRETMTDKDGSFQLLPLLRGTYTLKVSSSGFRTLERKSLVLDAYQILNIGVFRMEVGEIINTVTVTAEAPVVETATGQKSFVISSQQVTGISTNGRDFRSLLRTLPGVTSNTQSDFNLAFNSTQGFNVNGLRDTANNVYLDGAINTDVGANDGQFTQMSLDAIGEFKVQNSNFSAEHGRNPGILISATTKSGGRAFHGTAYEFLRNEALDARSPFAAAKSKLRLNQFGGNASGPIPLWKISSLNDPKLFFFFNMEITRGTRPNGPAFFDVAHPDILTGDLRRLLRADTLTGSSCLYPGETVARLCQVGTVFRPGTVIRNSAGNIIGGVPYLNNTVPQSEWNPNARAFLNVINKLDRTGATSPSASNPELVRVFKQDSYRLRKRQEVVRIDYNINPKNNFFFCWVDDSQDEDQGLGIFSGNSYPVLPQFRKKPGSSWSWNLVTVMSPTVTNEFIFSYNHLTQLVDIAQGVDKASYDRDTLGFTFKELYPNANLQNSFPRFNCGVGACGFSNFANQWESEARQFTWTDNVTIVRGSHTYKTGGFFNMNRNGQQPAWTDTINLNFGSSVNNLNDTGSTFANMLLCNYTSANQSNGKFFGTFKFYGVETFGQDSWKVSNRFTLEYGLRWVYLGPTFTYGDLLQNYFLVDRYDPAKAVRIQTASGATRGSIIPGSGNPFNGMVEEYGPIPTGGVKHRKNQFSPRIGFAWDLFGDARTALRGGAGIFFERIRQNNAYFDGLGNPPLTYTPSLSSGNISGLGPALVESGARFPVTIRAIDPEGKIPTIYSWSLGVQHEMAAKIGVEIGYVGNVARHMMYQRDIGQLPLGTTIAPGFLAAVNNTNEAVRPFKGYNGVNFVEFGASSNYHALQTRVGRRFGSNFTFNVNYTWGKAIDETDGDTDTLGYYLNRLRERAVAGYDRTHVLTVDYIYNLPKFSSALGSNGFTRTALDGWVLSGVTRRWTGLPFSVTSNGNPGTLGGGVRANYLGGEILVKDEAARQWFNPFVFARPPDGQLGNTGRNFLRGPGFTNFDLSLFKTFKFTERVSMQYRAEFFNLFNHTQWFGVNTGINVPNENSPLLPVNRGQSGLISNTRDSRNIQMALKLFF